MHRRRQDEAEVGGMKREKWKGGVPAAQLRCGGRGRGEGRRSARSRVGWGRADALELSGLCEVDEVLCPIAGGEDGRGGGGGGLGRSRGRRHRFLQNALLGVSGGGASPASPPGTAPPILALSHARRASLPPPRATALSSRYLQSSISPGTLLDLFCSSGHRKSCIHQFFVA